MATKMYGADADQLDRLALALRAVAEDLDREVSGLTRVLGNTAWLGPIATEFTGDWQGQLAPAAARVSGWVREHAAAAARNATDQRNASAAEGGGVGAGVVSWPGMKPEDPFDDKHTVREVREYFDHRYVSPPRGGPVEDMVIQTALDSNKDHRSRQGEKKVNIAWLYKDMLSRPHNDEFPELSAMDSWVLESVLPWADVQAIEVIGYDGEKPIFAVVTSRLPSFEEGADAITLGHFILIDKESALGKNPHLSYKPNPTTGGSVELSDDMLYHELTHLHRAQQSASFDEYGRDDRGWYYNYLFNHEDEEAVAYQVGLRSKEFPLGHVVTD